MPRRFISSRLETRGLCCETIMICARLAVYVAIQITAKRHQVRLTTEPPRVLVDALSMLNSA